MLYTANEPSRTNFIECHLEESKVACSFSSGGDVLELITSKATYSDGKWHTVCTICFRFITTILVKTFNPPPHWREGCGDETFVRACEIGEVSQNVLARIIARKSTVSRARNALGWLISERQTVDLATIFNIRGSMLTRPGPAHCGLEHQLEESRAKRSQSSEERKRRYEEMRLKHNLKLWRQVD